jgi:hypothetical protein
MNQESDQKEKSNEKIFGKLDEYDDSLRNAPSPSHGWPMPPAKIALSAKSVFLKAGLQQHKKPDGTPKSSIGL